MSPRRWSVAFRTDASVAIGAGHVMRCLALAESLRERGERVAFACRELPGDLSGVIRERGFEALALPAAKAGGPRLAVAWERDVAETLAALGGPVARLVIDHYGIDRRWEHAARESARRIAVIDDLADRPHDADLLVDQNLSASAAGYAARVPETCERLLGPSFALVGPAHAALRERAAARRDGRVARVLVSFGGGDVVPHTLRALEAVARAPLSGLAFDVIVPESAPGREAVCAAAAALPNVTLSGRVTDMAERMASADFMLGAAGSQSLERCCLGLPAAVVTIAPNQEAPARALAEAGACWWLGAAPEVGAEGWAKVLGRAMEDARALAAMSRAAMRLVDGQGVTRVADAVLAGAPVGPHRLRPIDERDLEIVWRWRNSEAVRQWMFSQDEIAWEDHVRWFAETRRSPVARALVFESAGVPLGLVKFDREESAGGACEWGFYIGEPEAPRGSGTRMGWLGLEYAFAELDLSRVRGAVTESNARSLRYHERLGFTRSGASQRPTRTGLVPFVSFELTRECWRGIAERLRLEAFSSVPSRG